MEARKVYIEREYSNELSFRFLSHTSHHFSSEIIITVTTNNNSLSLRLRLRISATRCVYKGLLNFTLLSPRLATSLSPHEATMRKAALQGQHRGNSKESGLRNTTVDMTRIVTHLPSTSLTPFPPP
ncbi:hypothetical protein E2C01_030442 [Portunus trituberculatus]|uniref:Uncharacterized protein n=1 Tax=Portunus trituberculatus TaxID=210409 RepID=A0A5B7EQF9_PORTR|nr:hypothetical protein [Portunus trituberculatus]